MRLRICPEGGYGSVVVVREIVKDGVGAVELLGKEEADHFVGEGHAGEGHFFAGACIDIGREAVGASDDEDKPLADGMLLVAEAFRKFPGCWLFAAFVKENNMVGSLQARQDCFPLGLLLELRRQFPGGLHIRNFNYLERYEAADAGGVFFNAGAKGGGGCLSHGHQDYFHRRKFVKLGVN